MLTALAMVIPFLLNEFTRQPTLTQVLVGLLAHVTSALPGIMIGALFSNPIVRRQGYALAGVLLCLLRPDALGAVAFAALAGVVHLRLARSRS